MKRITHARGPVALSLLVCLAWAPTVRAVNYVVDGLNGADSNSGVSATGGPGDLPGLDFTNAFNTIGQATSVTVPGDFIFVNAGQYAEQVVPTTTTTLIAVGEVVVANVATGFVLNIVGGVTLDGFTIRNCNAGVAISDASASLRNLTIRNCANGLLAGRSTTDVRRCLITDCNTGIFRSGPSPISIEQSTVVRNGTGVSLNSGGGGNVIRNNIVAFNTLLGVSVTADVVALVDFNDVIGNGTDYNITPGPNDVSVDPQFVDLSRRILHLQPTSPLINAGEELGGGPAVTIGAREIGLASSDALDGWADWIDQNGALLTSGLSTLVEIDAGTGHIVLKAGVNRASVRSPVLAGSLKSVEFGALEDLAPLSGSRGVIDQADATLQRELRFRGSDTVFSATDAAPAFSPIFEGQVLESIFGFVQVELTLTRNGL